MTQKQALKILKDGHNVFLTGAAGSGKTYLINQYIHYLDKLRTPIAITASTGIAASHINGITIHAWSGIGIKDKMTDAEIKKNIKKPFISKRLTGVKVLIIDEISMLAAHTLDLVNRVCKLYYKNNLAFGGLQVIMCGDFFQLPPVSPHSQFTYNSNIWKNMDLKICYLEEQYRQTDDKLNFLLNAIRNNKVSPALIQKFKDYCTQNNTKPKITPTKLYTHNNDVDHINKLELDFLPKKAKTYVMAKRGKKQLADTLAKNCLAPEELKLKKNAVVMFVKNDFKLGYINGSLGRIIDFYNKYPVVELLNGRQIIASPREWSIEEKGRIVASVIQVPLRLAWAITVHKSQGMSLDAAEIDLSKSFVTGMGYVALSRVRTLDGIYLRGINNTAFKISPEIINFDKKIKEKSL